MSKTILMPESMASGTLARWLKRTGDRIQTGEIVAEVETDKATMSIESPHQGTLVEITVSEGTAEVEAGRILAVVAD
jgi:pyruvate/2-oxoglutarate dehydrogenase complex dihydrolipoamide acyltransferase (E2) component